MPEEAWSSGQSGRLWIIEAGGPGFESSSDQEVCFLLSLGIGGRNEWIQTRYIACFLRIQEDKNKKNNS